MANSRRLQTPNLSNALHRWLLITGSRGHDLPDFAIRKPLPNEKRDLNFFADARAQKQGAQVLFYGAGLRLSWPEISWLLPACASKFKTCPS